MYGLHLKWTLRPPVFLLRPQNQKTDNVKIAERVEGQLKMELSIAIF